MLVFIIYVRGFTPNITLFPTLYNHLVTGHEDLLPIAGLCVLQYGGTWLGATGVRHGQRLQAICAVVGQLDGPSLGNGDCRGTRKSISISPKCISKEHKRPRFHKDPVHKNPPAL